jgi:hypothetical protein
MILTFINTLPFSREILLFSKEKRSLKISQFMAEHLTQSLLLMAFFQEELRLSEFIM